MIKLSEITSQEQLDKIIQDKADSSFKAGLAKGASSNSSTEELQKAKDTIARLEEESKSKDTELKNALAELTPFKEQKQFEEDFNGFKEAGGLGDIDLSDYNYTKFKNEDGAIDWDKFFEKQPHLKTKEEKPQPDGTLVDQGERVEIDEAKAMIDTQTATKFANV